MKNKISNLLGAVDEVDTLGGDELEKVKVILIQIMDLMDGYSKYDNSFSKSAEGHYIRILADMAFDYVFEAQKRSEKLSEYLYKEFKEVKERKTETKHVA